MAVIRRSSDLCCPSRSAFSLRIMAERRELRVTLHQLTADAEAVT